MDIFDDRSLPEAAARAVEAKKTGTTFIDFEIVGTSQDGAHRVRLWDGVAGEVRGRIYKQPEAPPVPDIPRSSLHVERLCVRANAVDVIEAYRRRLVRDAETEKLVRSTSALVDFTDLAR